MRQSTTKESASDTQLSRLMWRPFQLKEKNGGSCDGKTRCFRIAKVSGIQPCEEAADMFGHQIASGLGIFTLDGLQDCGMLALSSTQVACRRHVETLIIATWSCISSRILRR